MLLELESIDLEASCLRLEDLFEREEGMTRYVWLALLISLWSLI